MSDENSTQFQFRLGGIELEISGDREFVEQMYMRVMRDIEAARRGLVETPAAAPTPAAPRAAQILWVHRCSPMMHKIYMSSPAELEKAHVMRQIDTSRVKILFADKSVFERILPGVEKGATLWAELTAMGRKRIAEVTEK